MRYKLTLFLLGCNIIVFCLVHYMDKRADSARRLEEQSTLVLRPGSIEQADSLELSGHGVPTPWRLQRQDGRWLMVEPQTWPVNPFAVENILDQLRFMRMETSFAVSEIESSGMTLADYGLDNPSVVLKIGSASGQALLRIGAPTRVGGRLYVLSDDGTRAFVTSRDILSALLVDLDKLRNLQVFDIPPYSVGSISVQRADGARLRLNKTDGRWHFESPIRVGADSDAVDAFIASLTGIRIRTFAQQDPAAQGLLSPRLRIGIESPEKRLSLLIGAPTGDGGVFAKLDNSPEVFTVDESLVDMLSRMQEQLRERRFSRFGQTPPDRVTVSLDGQGATLQRLETGDWQVLISGEGEGVTTWKADKAVITTMLEALDMMQALRFVSDAPSEADLEGFGFNQPQRKVQLQFGGHSRTLVFGDLEPRTRGVYVKIADEPFVYEVGAAVLDKLSPLPLFYRSRELETLPPAARITHLRLVRLSDGAAVLDEGPALGEGWEGILNSPDDKRNAALTTLLDFARAGRAGELVSRGFSADAMHLGDDKSLPWAWRLQAQIELPTGTTQSTTRTIQYVFSERVAGTTQFGASESLAVTFTLTQAMIDALHALTYVAEPPVFHDLGQPDDANPAQGTDNPSAEGQAESDAP